MATSEAHRAPRLYSYIVRVDDGAAPNPYNGMCTLAICKPAIRRTAREGDWILGTGSAAAGLDGRMIYAMRVDEAITLEEYDRRAPLEWKHRIPDMSSRSRARRRGDCIYDYSAPPWPRQRQGVHGPGNRDVDLGGKNVLIGREYTYFGEDAVELPRGLRSLVHRTQGHKWKLNAPLLDRFVSWVEGQPRGMLGKPGFAQRENSKTGARGCDLRCSDDHDGQLCIRQDDERS